MLIDGQFVFMLWTDHGFPALNLVTFFTVFVLKFMCNIYCFLGFHLIFGFPLTSRVTFDGPGTFVTPWSRCVDHKFCGMNGKANCREESSTRLARANVLWNKVVVFLDLGMSSSTKLGPKGSPSRTGRDDILCHSSSQGTQVIK